jgi:anti-sigma factor ChrR (cupin superfamily)
MADKHVKPDDIDWEILREGLKRKILFRDEVRNFEFNITKISPNFVSPTHSHKDDEWVYILEGSMKDDTGKYNSGEFILNKKGSSHTVYVGPEGCTLLIFCSGFPY